MGRHKVGRKQMSQFFFEIFDFFSRKIEKTNDFFRRKKMKIIYFSKIDFWDIFFNRLFQKNQQKKLGHFDDPSPSSGGVR